MRALWKALDFPGHNSLTGKATVPDQAAVIDAVARRDQTRVVDGLTAANDLGLTTAVPARVPSTATACNVQGSWRLLWATLWEGATCLDGGDPSQTSAVRHEPLTELRFATTLALRASWRAWSPRKSSTVGTAVVGRA